MITGSERVGGGLVFREPEQGCSFLALGVVYGVDTVGMESSSAVTLLLLVQSRRNPPGGLSTSWSSAWRLQWVFSVPGVAEKKKRNYGGDVSQVGD